jgi:hypothetical protein
MKNALARTTLAATAFAATFALYLGIGLHAFTSPTSTFGSQDAMMQQAAARYERSAQ